MPMRNHNLFAHFQAQFSARGDDELLTTGDGRKLSYADINRCSARIAEHLTDLGVQLGERVSVQVKKSPENLCLYLACLRGGFVFHPLNMGYQKAELEYFLGDAEPSVLVCDSEHERRMIALARAAHVKHVLTMDGDEPRFGTAVAYAASPDGWADSGLFE